VSGVDVESVLRDHEPRWTTYGDVRLYGVIHCAGECDWSLRQKMSMSDDQCYAAHRAHVAAVLNEQIVAAQAEALDDVEQRIRHQAKAAPVGSMEWRAHFADLAHIEAARAAQVAPSRVGGES
jgi:hypothetical protein